MLKYLPQVDMGQTVSPILHRMTDTLLLTFKLETRIQRAIQNHHQANSLEEGIQLWLINLIVIPDEQLGELMIPIITTRFAEYLERLRRTV